MSVFVNFGIILLAALVHASLQLNLGGLILLYHSSLGNHVKKKTRILASNFILGVVFMILLGLLAAAFVTITFRNGSFQLETLSFFVGILLALTLIIWFAYYRTGRSTELWLPKSVTKFITSRAQKTSSRVEAFSLGMLTSFAEFPFSLILILLAADTFLQFSSVFQIISIFIYSLIAISPLLICRFLVRRGDTVAEIQRWRVKNKTFLRVLSGAGFLVLALFLFAFKIAGNL